MGLKIEGSEITPFPVYVDSSFEKCPIAHAAGIPVYVKRLFNEPRVKSKRYKIVRIMSDPKIGLAANDWQYGGLFGPAPTVLMGRMDGIDFSLNDWAVLDDF